MSSSGRLSAELVMKFIIFPLKLRTGFKVYFNYEGVYMLEDNMSFIFRRHFTTF
jgi:hypothetical protein